MPKGNEASVYYSMMIQNLGNGALSALKKAWERDVNLKLDVEEWDRICKNIKIMSRDARVGFIKFKIMHRFYWTPSRFFRPGLRDTPNCW